MIEKTVLNFLSAELSVPVFMEVPEREPEKYVVLEKVGSGKINHICTASFAVQSYAPTLYEAAELNEEAKSAMERLATLDEIGRVALDSDYPFTNTATKQRRYQALFDLTHY